MPTKKEWEARWYEQGVYHNFGHGHQGGVSKCCGWKPCRQCIVCLVHARMREDSRHNCGCPRNKSLEEMADLIVLSLKPVSDYQQPTLFQESNNGQD